MDDERSLRGRLQLSLSDSIASGMLEVLTSYWSKAKARLSPFLPSVLPLAALGFQPMAPLAHGYTA
jgi:hypothetical protein